MANLSYSEKKRLENFLDMRGGYVLNFSNNTLQRFVHDAIGIDIYNSKKVYVALCYPWSFSENEEYLNKL